MHRTRFWGEDRSREKVWNSKNVSVLAVGLNTDQYHKLLRFHPGYTRFFSLSFVTFSIFFRLDFGPPFSVIGRACVLRCSGSVRRAELLPARICELTLPSEIKEIPSFRIHSTTESFWIRIRKKAVWRLCVHLMGAEDMAPTSFYTEIVKIWVSHHRFRH